MRHASSLTMKWMSVLTILGIFTLANLSFAQTSKKKHSKALLPQATHSAVQPLVTTDTWTGGGGSSDTDWSDTSNWNNGSPSGDNVVIGLTTAATNVDQSFSIGALTLSNAGDSVTINSGETLTVGGNISNAGTITLGATSAYTYLDIGANLTLSGSGTLVLGSSAPYNIVEATGAGIVLTNSSTIEGEGAIGNNGDLVLNNATGGIINANVSGENLTLSPDTSVASTNAGTLEATGGGQLVLSQGSWTNTGGTISAATGSDVLLENVTITGGTLTTAGTGVINGSTGVTLSGVTNSGQYVLENGGSTYLTGNLINNGTVTLGATSEYTYLYIDANNVTLSGSGTVVLGSSTPYNIIAASSSGNTLTNEITIEGEGTISNDSGLIVNNAGTINANVSGATLNIYYPGASTNSSLLEATGGGTLELESGSWTNTSGNITAATGSTVLLDGTSITGGTLNGNGTGIIYGDGGTALSGVTINGNFQVQNGNTTTLSGTINNTGTITLAASSSYTYLDVGASGATLSGGGTVVMGTTAQYSVIEGPSGETLTNSNNIIEGTGYIGEGELNIVNNGTINANVSPTVVNGPLELEAYSSGSITNTGTLEATNGGTLEIYGSTLNNSGSSAVIEALGADSSGNASNVVLYGSTINGGTLTTSGSGVIYGEAGTTLAGVTNSGNFAVVDGSSTYLTGTINNTGTITLNDTSATYTELNLAANTTLTGSGKIIMGNGAQYSLIGGEADGLTLTNSNNTIEGDGYIGYGELNIVNNGTIIANTSGETLELDPYASGSSTSTNTATMEATSGGTLELYLGSWTNTGGTISAAAGSTVLLNDTTVTGGTLTTTGTGVIEAQSSTLVGLTISGSLQVPDGYTAYLSGAIDNTGTITINDTSATYTSLDLAANTTLTGKGTIIMGNGAQYSVIGGETDGLTLTNSNNTIEGDGYLGYGEINIVNSGTINANTSGETLQLAAYSSGTSTNTATMEATGGGTLELYTGSWTNTGGTISAAAGSTVLLYDTTVTGGTLTSTGTGVILAENDATLVSLTNSGNLEVPDGGTAYLSGTITNNGTITIDDTSATYSYLDLAANTTLSGKGTLVMGNGAQYSVISGASGLTFTNSGNTIEGDGNIGEDELVVTNASGSIISNVNGQSLTIYSSGAGFTNDGTVEATNGGTLVISGTLTNYSGTTDTLTSGTYTANGGNITYNFGNATGITTLSASVTQEGGGQLINTYDSADTNALANLTSITSTGALTTNVNFTDSGAFSNAGSLTILADTTFKVGSLTQISSGSLTAGTYVLDSNLDITGAAQTITTNAATLTLAGGTIENTSNNTNALSTLASNTGKLTLGSGIAFTTTATSFSNTGTLTLGTGSNFIAPALTQISGTTLSGGTFVLGGDIDLNSGVSITTNSSTLTLEGTGTIESGSTNALAGLATNTKSLTLADDADFTTAGNFSNTGTLTVDSGSTFTVTGKFTQFNSTTNTLSGGTYVVGGDLDLALGANGIETDSANVTLDGTGEIVNTSASDANGLVNLNTISSTGALTLASDANFTTAGNFTNSGKLTVDAGSTLTVTGTLSNLSSGTLTGGTYTVGGTLQLASANGGITTNAATLTLTGTAAKILDGTSNALSTFDNNTGSLTLSSAATLTTATTGSFSNSGTVDVSKGTTLTVGGTDHAYDQTAGTTTVDGTLTAAGGVSLTGGTIQGAGTLKGNTSNGATLNVGDAGKAGLLTITGTYTQLSTATLNVSIGGTTVNTEYSQLKISGTASLGGTLTAALVNSFTPTVGQTFTILTASSISGTFSTSTIAINSSEHFVVSYTSTSVILTVVSGAATSTNTTDAASQVAVAKPASKTTKPVAIATGRYLGTVADRPLLLATGKPTPVETVGEHIWDGASGTPTWGHVIAAPIVTKPIVTGDPARHINVNDGLSQPLAVRSPLNSVETKRIPVKILTPTMPRLR